MTLHHSLTVSDDETAQLLTAAESIGTPVPGFLAAAVAGLFHRLSGTPEFMMRLAVANRVGAARRTPGLVSNWVLPGGDPPAVAFRRSRTRRGYRDSFRFASFPLPGF